MVLWIWPDLGIVAVQRLQLALGEAVLVYGLADLWVLYALQQVGGAVVRPGPHGGDELLYDVLDKVRPHVANLHLALFPHLWESGQDLGDEEGLGGPEVT